MKQTQYGLTSLDIEDFGGLNTLVQPTNLPPFMSPDCADVEFYPGLVKTRPGLTDQYPEQVIAGTFTGTVTYTLPDEITKRFLAFAGKTFYKDIAGILTSVSDAMKAGDLCNFSPAFGREYMAFGDGKHGVDIPRQYDDTHFDRVSQVGPGAGPTITSNPVVTIATMDRVNTVFGGGHFGSVVTVALDPSTPFLYTVGDLITISGADDVSFNGTFVICEVVDALNFLFYGSAVSAGVGTMTRSSDIVTASGIVGTGDFFLQAGADIVVTDASDPTFNGRFTVLSADYATHTASWAQVAADSTVTDGTVYVSCTENGTGANFYEMQVTVSAGVAIGTIDFSLSGGLSPYQVAGAQNAFQPYYAPNLVMEMSNLFPYPFGAPYFDRTLTAQSITGTIANLSWVEPTAPDGMYTIAGQILTPDASTANGTIGLSGNIAAGLHQCAVSFITRQGYITKPSPPVEFLAPGGTGVGLTHIPIGPENVIGRLVMFTAIITRPALTGAFFSIEATMRINDNTTTRVDFDFTEEDITGGTPTDALFNLVELGECSGVLNYASRMLWWGERAKLNNLLNLTFDGGWSLMGGSGGSDLPLGWISTGSPADNAGGARVASAIFGDAYAITGDGLSFSRGAIAQAALLDYLGNPIFRIGVAYSLRVTHYAAVNSGDTYSLFFDIYSPSLGTSVSTVVIPIPASTTPTETIVSLMPAQATLPSDIQFRLSSVDTLGNGKTFIIDNIEPFETPLPYNGSIVRTSLVEQPDAYQGTDGFLQPDPNNGQEIRDCFTLRNFLYIAKERSLYVTQADDNEPSQWNIQEVSNEVGTLSSRGVGVGEEWALIAGRAGLYYFAGGEPQKISEEIQPTWDAINWNYGHLIEVTVDTRRKRAYIAVPYGTSTTNNRILTLDFVQGFGDPMAHKGAGRKWAPWMMDAGCVDLIQVSDGTLQVFIGQDGLVSMLDNAALTDNGDKIHDYWQTGFFQNGSRLLFGYLSANVVGSGLVNITMRRGDQNSLKYVRGWNLTPDGYNNLERQIQYVGQRMAFKFGSEGTGDYFSLQGMKLYVEPSIWTPIRGINS